MKPFLTAEHVCAALSIARMEVVRVQPSVLDLRAKIKLQIALEILDSVIEIVCDLEDTTDT